jgi:Tfp pilus assembly protein PilN
MHDSSFLPDDYLDAARERRTNIAGLVLFAAMLGGVAIWFTRSNVEYREVRDRQAQVGHSFAAVADRIRDMQEQERTRQQMIERAQLAMSLIDPVPRSILLSELVVRMPERVSLVELNLRSEPVRAVRARPGASPAPRGNARPANRAGATPARAEPARPDPIRYALNIVLAGMAPTDLDVSEYLQALNACDLLESVRLELSEERLVGGRPTRHFRIAIRVAPEADVRRSRSLLHREGMLVDEMGGIVDPPSDLPDARWEAIDDDADPDRLDRRFGDPEPDLDSTLLQAAAGTEER